MHFLISEAVTSLSLLVVAEARECVHSALVRGANPDTRTRRRFSLVVAVKSALGFGRRRMFVMS